MKIISATEFKAKCLQLLDMVHATGEDLVVSKRGKPVVRVTAETPGMPWLALRGTGRFMGDSTDPTIPTREIEALK